MEVASPNSALKVAAVLVTMAILFTCVSANSGANYTVEWSLAGAAVNFSSRSNPLSLFVGDNLVFLYTPNHDVVEVDALDFAVCGIKNPIAVWDDGETMVPLTETGTRYFICARINFCSMGLKLEVQVNNQLNPNPASPSPSPAGVSIGSDIEEPEQSPATPPPINDFTDLSPPPTPPPFNFTVQNCPPPSPFNSTFQNPFPPLPSLSNLSESDHGGPGSYKDGEGAKKLHHGQESNSVLAALPSANITGASTILLLVLIASGNLL